MHTALPASVKDASARAVSSVPSSFYEKAAGMLLAAGAATTTADAGVVYWHGSGITDTGNLAPGGDLVALQVIGTTAGSTAYGFVKGIGNLSLPTGDLAGFFREASAPTVGPTTNFGSDGGELRFFVSTTSTLPNNAQVSADNLFAFSFTSGAVNGGNPVFGWARLAFLNHDLSGPTFGAHITAWAYDDTGAAIQLGAIPEPSSLALLAAGAAGGVACFRRHRNRRQDDQPAAG